jgi:hypothetical protein
MTRPRKMTTCRRTSYSSDAERALIALHRMEHKRLDRRRAQWRAYGARKRAPERDDLAGYLHELGCSGKHRGVRHNGSVSCTPIPVYRELPEAA